MTTAHPDALRATLAQAFKHRTTAQASLSKTVDAVSQCDARIKATKSDIAALGDVDLEVATRAAVKIGMGVVDVLEVPANLAQRQAAHAAAEQSLKVLQAARTQLVDEVEGADRRHRLTEMAVASAAEDILTALTDEFAQDLHQARQNLCDAYDRLGAVCRLTFAGASPQDGMRPLRLASKAVRDEIELAGLAMSLDYFDRGLHRTSSQARLADWREFYTALLTNAYSQAPNS